MKKNRVVLGLIVLAVILLAVWAMQGGGQRFSWRETFKIDSKEPYGIYALYDLFKDYPSVKELNTLFYQHLFKLHTKRTSLHCVNNHI